MDLGIHLPLMQFRDEQLSLGRLEQTVDAARDCGFTAVSANDPAARAQAAWEDWKKKTFTGRVLHTPDVVAADVLNHYDYYSATGFAKAYPGETTVRLPSEFKNAFERSMAGRSSPAMQQAPQADDDGDGI